MKNNGKYNGDAYFSKANNIVERGLWTAWKDIPIVKTINRGLLLDGYWDHLHSGFYCIFYCDGKLLRWLDRSHSLTVSYLGDAPGAQYRRMYDSLHERDVMLAEIPVGNVWSSKTSVPLKGDLKIGQRIAREIKYFHRKQLLCKP